MASSESAENLLAGYDDQDSEPYEEIPQENPISLKRSLGIPGGTAFLIGTIIGSGIFATPKWVLFYVGSVGMSLVMWAFCGVISLLGALCYCELGTLIPKSGGEYQYLLKAYGPLPAFLYAWMSVLFMNPASQIMVLLVFGAYTVEAFLPGCRSREEYVPLIKLLAAAALGVITFVNCASLKWAVRIQIFFTAAKMIAIFMLVFTGIVRLTQGYTNAFENAFNGTSPEIGKFAFAFYNGLFSYNGWNQLNYVIEEIKNPERNLPLSIFIGIPLVIVCYLLVIIGYLTVLTPQEFLTTDAVAVTLANRLYGVMAWSIPILVSCSTFGSANGSAFSGGRLAFAAAREGHLPRFLAMIHTKRRTPLPGLIFSSIISFVMIIPDSSSFEVLLSYMGFFTWFGYLLSISSIIWLRYKEPEVRRPFKVWFGIPIFMVVVSLYLVIAPFYETPLQSFYCVLFVSAAIPFYFAFVRYEVVPRCFLLFFNRVTNKLQTICNVALPVEEGDIEASSSLMSQLSE